MHPLPLGDALDPPLWRSVASFAKSLNVIREGEGGRGMQIGGERDGDEGGREGVRAHARMHARGLEGESEGKSQRASERERRGGETGI